eukprot:PRCOL_00004871-RA
MGSGGEMSMRRGAGGFGSGDLYLLQRLSSESADSAKRNHDMMNLYILPWLATASVFGACGAELVPNLVLSCIFLAYIVFDFIWICLQPQCVPKAPLVLVHHVVTALLILHPVRFPEHGLYTCYDGLVEINTVILTFKRTVRFQHRGAKALVTFLHWSTFIALRMIAYPIFTKIFWDALIEEPGRYSDLEIRMCMFCQLSLLGFNCLFLHLMLTQKGRGGGRSRQAALATAMRAKARRAD